MALAPGSRLGSFEIIAPLGAGGMGEVYRARDPRLDRIVAIKILPAAFSENNERRQRFEQEARSASALNHPNIVTIYELGQDGSNHYIAMELVEGKTLRELIGSGLLPMRKAIEIAAQIADGLTKAHEAGITHRDLKPENLMVSGDGFVKILDFGLAKVTAPSGERPGIHSTTTTSVTDSGLIVGTVGIHVAGAGGRRTAGFQVRPVLVRLDSLRDGDGKASLSENHCGGNNGGHLTRTGRADWCAKSRSPSSAVLGHREMSGERAG